MNRVTDRAWPLASGSEKKTIGCCCRIRIIAFQRRNLTFLILSQDAKEKLYTIVTHVMVDTSAPKKGFKSLLTTVVQDEA